MRRTLSVMLGVILLLIASPAWAGSDSPTPYTLTTKGIQLAPGDVIRDNDHINVHTTDQLNTNSHFEAKCISRTDAECKGQRHELAQYIGKSFIPWSALGIPSNKCVKWVQISQYNEHFGEGGQSPFCLKEKPCPTPSPTPTVTPTPEPTPTLSPTPSPEPTTSPTPQPSPTASPEPEPTPGPSTTPTSEPTPSPSPDVTDTPAPSPTPTTPQPGIPTSPQPQSMSTTPSSGPTSGSEHSGISLATTGSPSNTPAIIGISLLIILGGATLILAARKNTPKQ